MRFKSIFIFILFYSIFAFSDSAWLDPSLETKNNRNDVSEIFDQVVAVQNKAKIKAGRFLFAPYFSFDFSDAPFTMYGLNLNFGYATSENFEFYLNYTPLYVSNEKSISTQVKQLTLSNGQQAVIATEKAASQVGFEMLWTPIYGKESWGPYGIVRSESFVDIAFGAVAYQSVSGMRTKLALGKTYFLSPSWNVRLCAGGSFVEMVTSGVKQVNMVGLLEGGLVYYF